MSGPGDAGHQRWGVTVPILDQPIAAHAELLSHLPDWGFTDAWSAEVSGDDAFTPLAYAAAVEPRLQLGTAIVPVFTRGPALIAQSAAALATAAPGRFRLGLGASSPAIVQQWNGIDFDRPYARTRDVLRFVRAALAGEKVGGRFDTFAVEGFRLDRAPAEPVPILLAALRPRMLTLAGREADGVILNWLAATDVAQCLAAVDNPEAEVVARIFVCPTGDADFARAAGRRMIAGYLTVDAYARYQRWLGRGEALAELWRRWAAGDRAGAAAAIPDEVVDALIVRGDPDRCRAAVAEYVRAGVGVPVLALLPTPELTAGADPGPELTRLLATLGRPLGPNEPAAADGPA